MNRFLFSFVLIPFTLLLLSGQELQEQSSILLRKEGIKKIDYFWTKEQHSVKKKSDVFLPSGLRSKVILYKEKNNIQSIYTYSYRSDSLLKETSHFIGHDTTKAVGGSIIDYNDMGLIIEENFVAGGRKHSGAYNHYEYNKKGQKTKLIHKRMFMESMLVKWNNLWVRQSTGYKETTLKRADDTKINVKTLDPENATMVYKFKYNKDGTLKEIEQEKPYEQKTMFEYDDRGLNTKQYAIEKDKKSLEFDCIYNQKGLPEIITNHFTQPMDVLTIYDIIPVKPGDVLVTTYHYLASGLIDYIEQSLNQNPLGKLEYLYFR